MGESHSTTYHEAGKRHGDTKSYKDEDMLTSHGHNPTKLTAIRVWWSEYMVGFEAFYDNISAGARMGSEFQHGTVYSDFILGADEFITKVTGRSGDLIDQITFHTNLGRKQQFGSSTGGSPFTLEEHGKVVVGFTVGFGGHLHFLGAHFGTATSPPKASGKAGKTHGDTVHFDDYKDYLEGKSNIRMTEIRVLHDNKMVFGVEGIYESNGHTISPGVHVGNEMNHATLNQSISLSGGKYITGISGRNGDVIDALTIHLSDGTQYNFGGTGGSAFGNIVPAGKRVVGLGGGLGGHMHNIFCYYQ